MPKRKAASGEKQDGADDAKKPRTSAARTAAAATTDDGGSFEAALARANLAPHIALMTLKLADAITATAGSWTQRMQAVVDLLAEDADQSESLIDLSLVVEGEKSCVLFQLLHFFCRCWPRDTGFDGEKADRTAAMQLIVEQVLPLMPKLLLSFDPDTVDAATGSNALHELCSYFTISPRSDYDYTLAELLIDHGVDVHARDKKGRTVLLKSASGLFDDDVSADGLRLLLAHGADPNAQDGNGNGALHHLVRNGATTLLEAFMSGDGSGLLDFHLVNSAGQTAFDLAATYGQQPESGGLNSAGSPQQRTRRLMVTQKTVWTKLVRPVLLRCLEVALPVADVANLALGYIDGSGLPFVTAAEGESNGEAEPAAAAAAAQS